MVEAVLEKKKNENWNIDISVPRGYNKIEKEVFKMMIENTGVHFLDSGYLYGRNWEKNRKIGDFKKLPKLSVRVDDDGVYFKISVFHFLTNILEINDISAVLNKRLKRYIDRYDGSYLAGMDDFMDKLESEGWKRQYTFNTYEYDGSILSQILQGIIFSDADENDFYVMLQIHNGCDVRGGYTFPRVFKLVDVDYFFIWQSDISAGCECGTVYSDDGGYHWYVSDGNLVVKEYGLPLEWENKDGKVVCDRCGKEVNFYVDF